MKKALLTLSALALCMAAGSAMAKEYKELGYNSVADWMKNAKAALKTKSAKELANKIESMNPTSWWDGLKKL